jgi:hypothetical protein
MRPYFSGKEHIFNVGRLVEVSRERYVCINFYGELG